MPVNFVPTASDYVRLLPEIVLSLFGIAIMMLEAVSKGKRTYLAYIALVGVAVAFLFNIVAYNDAGSAFQHMVVVDAYGTFFRGLVLVVGALCILASVSYLDREGAQGGEYYALILFSLVGQCTLATAADLIMVFIGLEISSIATYILADYLRDDRRNNESSLKYFLLGSFATAFLLYGIAWVYGMVGSTNLEIIRLALETDISNPRVVQIIAVAAALIFVGLGFQGLHRAVSDVGSRCVSRGGGARERLYVGWAEGGGICCFFQNLHDFVSSDGGAMDLSRLGLRAGNHVDR